MTFEEVRAELLAILDSMTEEEAERAFRLLAVAIEYIKFAREVVNLADVPEPIKTAILGG